MVQALVAIADGTEELEAVAVIDILRRAGAHVTVASVSANTQVKCSRGVVLVADALIEQVEDSEFDCIVCPGGMPGATNLANSAQLSSMLKMHAEKGKIIAAICAAPSVVLVPLGLVNGHQVTCHPAFAEKLPNGCSADRVVVSNNSKLVTSRGPGTAIEFALMLVSLLFDKAKMKEVQAPMLTHLSDL